MGNLLVQHKQAKKKDSELRCVKTFYVHHQRFTRILDLESKSQFLNVRFSLFIQQKNKKNPIKK